MLHCANTCAICQTSGLDELHKPKDLMLNCLVRLGDGGDLNNEDSEEEVRGRGEKEGGEGELGDEEVECEFTFEKKIERGM